MSEEEIMNISQKYEAKKKQQSGLINSFKSDSIQFEDQVKELVDEIIAFQQEKGVFRDFLVRYEAKDELISGLDKDVVEELRKKYMALYSLILNNTKGFIEYWKKNPIETDVMQNILFQDSIMFQSALNDTNKELLIKQMLKKDGDNCSNFLSVTMDITAGLGSMFMKNTKGLIGEINEQQDYFCLDNVNDKLSLIDTNDIDVACRTLRKDMKDKKNINLVLESDSFSPDVFVISNKNNNSYGDIVIIPNCGSSGNKDMINPDIAKKKGEKYYDVVKKIATEMKSDDHNINFRHMPICKGHYNIESFYKKYAEDISFQNIFNCTHIRFYSPLAFSDNTELLKATAKLLFNDVGNKIQKITFSTHMDYVHPHWQMKKDLTTFVQEYLKLVENEKDKNKQSEEIVRLQEVIKLDCLAQGGIFKAINNLEILNKNKKQLMEKKTDQNLDKKMKAKIEADLLYIDDAIELTQKLEEFIKKHNISTEVRRAETDVYNLSQRNNTNNSTGMTSLLQGNMQQYQNQR